MLDDWIVIVGVGIGGVYMVFLFKVWIEVWIEV